MVRPGRIDINVKFTNADMQMIRDMLCNFYSLSQSVISKLYLDPQLNCKFSPAKVIAILCNNYKNYETAINQLNSLVC